MNKYLIVGLGNIGTQYAHTRHNIGFDVADAFARKQGVIFRMDRLVEMTELKIKGRHVIIIKPTTFMNLSGKGVKYWMEKDQIALENLLVIVDEVALPLGKLRIKPSGSAGGHNGLKSIEESLLTDQYPRLRIGIGNNYPRGHQSEYVLGKWASTEEPLVQKKIEVCIGVIESFVLQGIGPSMNQFNKLNITL